MSELICDKTLELAISDFSWPGFLLLTESYLGGGGQKIRFQYKHRISMLTIFMSF